MATALRKKEELVIESVEPLESLKAATERINALVAAYPKSPEKKKIIAELKRLGSKVTIAVGNLEESSE